jgi:hypothetical protein
MTETQDDAAAVVCDLSSTALLESYPLKICRPGTNRPTGWVITLAGPSHPNSVEVQNEWARERLDKEKAIEFAQVNQRKWKVDDVDDKYIAQANRNTIRRLCHRILGWSPEEVTIPYVAPLPIKFSEAAATDLFLRPDMVWALNQITEYFNSERAFMSGSANS